jgi:hypothetical protein
MFYSLLFYFTDTCLFPSLQLSTLLRLKLGLMKLLGPSLLRKMLRFKKGGQGSFEAATPATHPKIVRKRRGRGVNHDAPKRHKTSHVATFEVFSSSPGESDHTKCDTKTHPPEVAIGFGTNIEVPSADPHEEIVDVTTLSPNAVVGATLSDPLNINYNNIEPESDKDCAPRGRSSKDKALVPTPSVVETVVLSDIEVPNGIIRLWLVWNRTTALRWKPRTMVYLLVMSHQVLLPIILA